MKKEKFTYEKSGVNINAADNFVKFISSISSNNKGKKKFNNIGGFGSITNIPKNLKNPKIVACTDGVGTKIEIAQEMNFFGTIGIDLVAMCVNDLLVCGAEPLVFLDYYVTDKLKVDTATEVIEGIAKGCELAKCSLVGGETAEHPGSFPDNSFDLAGFSLGVVDEDEMIGVDGPKIGDVLIGIESSGFHSNGFSLLRKVIKEYELDLKSHIGDEMLGEILLKPTHIYVAEILALKNMVNINAISHITGGGFFENIPRMLNKNQKALIKHDFQDWPSGAYYEWLKDATKISKENLLRTFNCGVGLVISVDKKDEETVLGTLNQSLFAKTIGEIKDREENEDDIKFV